MDNEEKQYIDKKFAEMEERMTNPDPQVMWDRAKQYRPLYYKYYWKWMVIALIATIGTMIITFRVVGLF